MAGPGKRIHLVAGVVVRPLVLVQGAHGDGRAERDAAFRAGLDVDLVGFVARGGQRGLAWPPTGQLRLDVGFGEAETGWAPVDYEGDAGAVGFSCGCDAEVGAEGGHGWCVGSDGYRGDYVSEGAARLSL